MLQNASFLAKIGADADENEQHFAEILPIGRRVADRCPGRPLEDLPCRDCAAAPPAQSTVTAVLPIPAAAGAAVQVTG